jgi:hypothetical protein
MSVEIDPKTLRNSIAALRAYRKATNKSAAETLNRYARNVLMFAIRFTPKTKLPKIRREVDPVKGKDRLLWKLAAKDGWKKGAGIGAEVQQRYNRRRSSKGFIAAGFFKALRVFGGRARAPFAGGEAAQGSGRKAKDSRLIAEFVNAATGADKVAFEPLTRAMNDRSADMLRYAHKRMQKDADKVSGKRR